MKKTVKYPPMLRYQNTPVTNTAPALYLSSCFTVPVFLFLEYLNITRLYHPLTTSFDSNRTSLRGIDIANTDKYVPKYKNYKKELEQKLTEYTNNYRSFVLTAGYLLKLAQNAFQIFNSPQTDQKNLLMMTFLVSCKIDQDGL